jgi:hypothetical protein
VKASTLLAQLRRHDAKHGVAGDTLRVVAPKHVLSDEIRRAIRARKYELLAIIESDDPAISWRIAAIRPLIPPRGPIHPPVIRRNRATAQGSCHCCGDPLSDERRLRCSPCSRAMWFVINEVREGVVLPFRRRQWTES